MYRFVRGRAVSGYSRVDFSQRGVALAIMVWFLAAMSLLVGGIVLQARMDVKLAQLHIARAQSAALADGAIQMALADLLKQEQDPEGDFEQRASHHGSFAIGRSDVAVTFTPVAGLIDLNKAPQELLFGLFSTMEDLDENMAEELAFNVVEWRSEISGLEGEGAEDELRHDSFEAIEDLLLVPGMDRTVFEAVRDAVSVSEAGQAGVDWISAPASVLLALGDVDEEFALELVKSRAEESAQDLMAPLELDMGFQESTALSSFRVDAVVKLDETVFRRRRWVDRSTAGADGLPWRYFRTEAVRVISQAKSDSLADLEADHAGN